MRKSVVIIVPVYKSTLNEFEKIAIQRLYSVLGEYTIVFCAPNSLNTEECEFCGNNHIEKFDDNFFFDIDGYNRLMMSKLFYERFSEYEYLLIYQLDAFVFSDRLQEFCDMDYDYIGAPWRCPFGKYQVKNKTIVGRVGNGGFSLRKVNTFILLCEKLEDEIMNWEGNEDAFWDYCTRFLDSSFKVAPVNVAMYFSFENFPDKWYKLNGENVPFGCHAWMKKSKLFYYDMFKKFGIDLGEYLEKMESSDREIEVGEANYIGNTFLKLRKYRPIGLPKDKEKKIIVWGNLCDTKDYVDYLLENGYFVETIYEKSRNTDEEMFYRQIPLILGEPVIHDNNFLIVGTILDEDGDVKYLSDKGLIYGIDFISFKKEIIEKWRRMLWMPMTDESRDY